MWMVQQDIRDIKVRFASKTLCNLEWQWAVLEIYQVLDNTAAEYGTDPYLPFFWEKVLGRRFWAEYFISKIEEKIRAFVFHAKIFSS